MVIVVGEAGIGKTALLTEVLADQDLLYRRVLRGHCSSASRSVELAPIAEALWTKRRVVPNDVGKSAARGGVERALEAFARSVRADSDPGKCNALADLVEELGGLGPSVLVLEDLQWADDLTVHFVNLLLRAALPELSLLLTCRLEDLPLDQRFHTLLSASSCPPQTRVVALRALSVEDLQQWASATLGCPVSQEVAEALHHVSGGVPQVLEELLHTLGRANTAPLTLDQLDWRWNDVEVPLRLEALWKPRTTGLVGPGARVVAALAVLGVPSDVATIAAVGGLSGDDCVDGLAAAIRRGVIFDAPASRYFLRHQIARQVAYRATPRPERERMHARAAAVLSAGDDLETVAYHFQMAGRHDNAVATLAKVSDGATAAGEYARAARLLVRALRLTPTCARTALELALKLGSAALYCGASEQNILAVKAVLEHAALNASERGELRLALARLLYHAGRMRDGRVEMSRSIGELGGESSRAAPVMLNLALPTFTDEDKEENLGWLRRAEEACAGQAEGALTRTVAMLRASILLSMGEPGACAELGDLLANGFLGDDRRQRLRCLHALAVSCCTIGRYGQARAYLSQVWSLEDRILDGDWSVWLDGIGARLDFATGNWEGLDAQVRALLTKVSGVEMVARDCWMILAFLTLARGEVIPAEKTLRWLLRLYRHDGPVVGVLPVSARLARITLSRGHHQETSEIVREALEVLYRKRIWSWGADIVPVAVDALLAGGAIAEAKGLLGRFDEGLRGREAPAARAAMITSEASLHAFAGRHDEAASCAARACELWAGLPRPYEAALLKVKEGRSRLAQGRRHEGRDVLLGALRCFDDLGARWDGAHLRRVMRVEGLAVPSATRGRSRYGSQLSPREREVVAMAASGQTNREIGSTLFLSPRTVEDHLASAMRKLGVRSRRRLGEALEGGEQPIG
jgi:DNA-binding CsgD family transcriptional regulator/predicted nucleic acid-binding protein